MPKDFYLILGVNRDADLKKIKSAYRRIAKKHHPDISETKEDLQSFLEAKRAYETLKDAKKRKQYNQDLFDKEHGSSRGLPVGFHSFFHHPDWNTAMEDFFSGRSRTAGESCQEFAFDLIISPREAKIGGVFPLLVPIRKRCPNCGGRSGLGFYGCTACGGYGEVETSRTFGIVLPACVDAGSELTFKFPAGISGMVTVYLRVLIERFP